MNPLNFLDAIIKFLDHLRDPNSSIRWAIGGLADRWLKLKARIHTITKAPISIGDQNKSFDLGFVAFTTFALMLTGLVVLFALAMMWFYTTPSMGHADTKVFHRLFYLVILFVCFVVIAGQIPRHREVLKAHWPTLKFVEKIQVLTFLLGGVGFLYGSALTA